jgi:hypothetical protein
MKLLLENTHLYPKKLLIVTSPPELKQILVKKKVKNIDHIKLLNTADDQGLFPGKGINLSFFHHMRTYSGTHPALYLISTGG